MKRGRPRKTDPDKALDIAMKMFWEQGFDGTSMNDLSACTGMAKPGLYATFGDKEAVYSKALERYFEKYGLPLVDDLAASPDPLDIVVRRFLQAIAAFVVDKSWPGGCFAINSVVDCANQSPSLEGPGRAFHERRRNAFVQRFRAAQATDELPKEADPDALGEFFAGQVLALGVMGSGGADLKALNQLIDVAMTALPTGKGC
jgi:AcrR family transcriptional regulator